MLLFIVTPTTNLFNLSGPTSKYVKERGRVYTKPVIQDDQRNALDIVFGAESPHIPNQYWRRQKQIQWGNAAWQNKTE